MTSRTIIVLISIISIRSFASIPSSIPVENALRLPLESRVEQIKKQGAEGEKELLQIAFNPAEPLGSRWRAVTALGRIFPKTSKPALEKALNSDEWFMRNAAMIVLPYNDKTWAIGWARLLMHDPALVVRTAAVKVLRQFNARETRDLLWEKLYSSENYRAGQSLWIRRHILEALAQFADSKNTQQFIRVLSDKDASLHPIAMNTLQRLTNKKYETSHQWVSWWEKSKVL